MNKFKRWFSEEIMCGLFSLHTPNRKYRYASSNYAHCGICGIKLIEYKPGKWEPDEE